LRWTLDRESATFGTRVALATGGAIGGLLKARLFRSMPSLTMRSPAPIDSISDRRGLWMVYMQFPVGIAFRRIDQTVAIRSWKNDSRKLSVLNLGYGGTRQF